MRQHQNVWLPDGETHLQQWMDTAGEIVDGKGTYLIDKYRAAVAACRQFRTAVDVGAHCGLWSMQAVKQFKVVHAFEPIAEHRECFLANVGDKAWLYDCALGNRIDRVSMSRAQISSAESWVDGVGEIPMCKLDSFDLPDVDLIKLHCVGSEFPVLQGAGDTIARYRPVIAMEQKQGRGTRLGWSDSQASDYLLSIGYTLWQSIRGDNIMVPLERPPC